MRTFVRNFTCTKLDSMLRDTNLDKKTISRTTIIHTLITIVVLVTLYFFVRRLSGVLLPFLISLVIAYMLAPIVNLSEVIVDIVETGSTLKENGLGVLEEICPLSARMVVNQVSMKMENDRINKLIKDLKTVL